MESPHFAGHYCGHAAGRPLHCRRHDADRPYARGVEQPERLIDIMLCQLDGVRAEANDLVVGALARVADVASMDPSAEPIIPDAGGRPSCPRIVTS